MHTYHYWNPFTGKHLKRRVSGDQENGSWINVIIETHFLVGIKLFNKRKVRKLLWCLSLHEDKCSEGKSALWALKYIHLSTLKTDSSVVFTPLENITLWHLLKKTMSLVEYALEHLFLKILLKLYSVQWLLMSKLKYVYIPWYFHKVTPNSFYDKPTPNTSIIYISSFITFRDMEHTWWTT